MNITCGCSVKNKYVKHAHISEVMFRKVLKLFCADIPALTAGGLTGLSVQGTPPLDDLVAFADDGTGAGRGPAFCGRSGDRRKLLWAAPGARQTRAWRGRQDPGDRPAQARGQGLHRDRL